MWRRAVRLELVLIRRLKQLADAARRGAHAVHERLVLLALVLLCPTAATLIVVLANSRAHLHTMPGVEPRPAEVRVWGWGDMKSSVAFNQQDGCLPSAGWLPSISRQDSCLPSTGWFSLELAFYYKIDEEASSTFAANAEPDV